MRGAGNWWKAAYLPRLLPCGRGILFPLWYKGNPQKGTQLQGLYLPWFNGIWKGLLQNGRPLRESPFFAWVRFLYQGQYGGGADWPQPQSDDVDWCCPCADWWSGTGSGKPSARCGDEYYQLAEAAKFQQQLFGDRSLWYGTAEKGNEGISRWFNDEGSENDVRRDYLCAYGGFQRTAW